MASVQVTVECLIKKSDSLKKGEQYRLPVVLEKQAMALALQKGEYYFNVQLLYICCDSSGMYKKAISLFTERQLEGKSVWRSP